MPARAGLERRSDGAAILLLIAGVVIVPLSF